MQRYKDEEKFKREERGGNAGAAGKEIQTKRDNAKRNRKTRK
jgi:hypothetical protein